VRRLTTGALILAILLGASSPSWAKWIWRDNKWVYVEETEPPLPLPKAEPPSVGPGTPVAPTPAPPPTVAPTPIPVPTPAPTPTRAPAPVPTAAPKTAPVAKPMTQPQASVADFAATEAKQTEARRTAGEGADLYEIGRSQIAAGQFNEGAKTLRTVIDKYPLSALREESMWLRAAAILATGDHYASFEQLEELVTQYAGSPHYQEALQKEIKIADAFLTGTHRKVWGMTSMFSAEPEGIEILRKVYEHQPRGDLAEAVVLRIADYHWTKREWSDAEDYYDKYCREFPNGPSVRRAELLRAKCAIERCRGPRYDTTSLQLAYDRLNQFKQKYPEEAQRENVAGLMETVRDMQAQGLFEQAAQYGRARKLQAASYYAVLLRDRFPDSPWAERAAPYIMETAPAKEEPKP
jgi:outer membrane protein assembly factor BamD (BamD/ComL family)